MSFGLNVALLEATGAVVQGRRYQWARLNNFLRAGFFNALVGLVDVLDVPFEHE